MFINLYANLIYLVFDPQLFYRDKTSIFRLITFVAKDICIFINLYTMKWNWFLLVAIGTVQLLQYFLDRKHLVVTRLLLFFSNFAILPFITLSVLGLQTHNRYQTYLRVLGCFANVVFTVWTILSALSLYQRNYVHWCWKGDVWSGKNILPCPPPDSSPVGDFSLNEVYPMCTDVVNVDCTRKSYITVESIILHDLRGTVFSILVLGYFIVVVYSVNRYKPRALYKSGSTSSNTNKRS